MYRIPTFLQRVLSCSQLGASSGSLIISQFPRLLSTQQLLHQKTKDVHSTPNECSSREEKRKVKLSVNITLKEHSNSSSVMSLEDARKLAKRRGLSLVEIQEALPKGQRKVYKLVTAAEMLEMELEELKPSAKDIRNNTRSRKELTIGSRISDNDLTSRLKSISKWLIKNQDVRILIQGAGGDVSVCEKIAKTIELSVKEPQMLGKVVQKSTKGPNIKLVIVPFNATTTKTVDNSA